MILPVCKQTHLIFCWVVRNLTHVLRDARFHLVLIQDFLKELLQIVLLTDQLRVLRFQGFNPLFVPRDIPLGGLELNRQ